MNLCPRRLSNANPLESEATAGIEPAMKVLQTSALPLGYVAMSRRASFLAAPAEARNEVIGPLPYFPGGHISLGISASNTLLTNTTPIEYRRGTKPPSKSDI